MLTLIIFVGLLVSMLGAFLAFKKRRARWLVATLPLLLVPLALYAVIAFACYFGNDCP